MSEVAEKSPAVKLVKKQKAKVEEVVSTSTDTVGEVQAIVKEESPQVETDVIVSTAKEIENLKEDKAFKLVPQLLNGIDHDYFKLGGVLSVIQANGWFMDKGYENFRQFVEAEYNIPYRKTMYLIAIYNGLVGSGVKWEQVKHLGWTKMKELAAHLTKENVAEWVAAAESMTVIQLQEYIKAKTAAVEGTTGDEKAAESVPTTTTMTFKLHPDQKVSIREALDKCKHETGTEHDTVALEHICLDYLGGSTLKTMPTLLDLMKGKAIEEVLTALEEAFPGVGMEVTLPE